jgi:hypothetical protein
LRIFRLATVAGANAVGLLLGASFFGFIFVGTLYMQQVLGYSALQTGLAWLAASITSVALAGASQALVTRVSAKLVMALGMGLIGGGILWATAAPVDGGFWHDLAGPFFVAGAGTAFAFIPVSIAALAGIADKEAGLASGLLNTSQQIGGAIGVAIASTMPPRTSRRSSTPARPGRLRSPAASSGRSGSAARSGSRRSRSLSCSSAAGTLYRRLRRRRPCQPTRSNGRRHDQAHDRKP